MPNWCSSRLYISGGKKELNKFKDFANTKADTWGRNVVLDTNKFIPYPKKYLEMDRLGKELYELKQKNKLAFKKALILANLEKEGNKPDNMSYGFNSGGYEWCSKHWGTKWGICDSFLQETDGELQYSFETAWNTCFPVIFKMSKMFPKLNFHYFYEEESGEFAGNTTILNGKIIGKEDTTKEWQTELNTIE